MLVGMNDPCSRRFAVFLHHLPRFACSSCIPYWVTLYTSHPATAQISRKISLSFRVSFLLSFSFSLFPFLIILTTIALPGQSDVVLQLLDSSSSPSQFPPSFAGGGYVHDLDLLLFPVPHGLLQSVHSVHSLQFPLTDTRKSVMTHLETELNRD